MKLTQKQKYLLIGGGVLGVVVVVVLYFVFVKDTPKNTQPKTTPKNTPPKTTPPKKTDELPNIITKNTDPVFIKAKNGYLLTITDKDDLIKNKSKDLKQVGCRAIALEPTWLDNFKNKTLDGIIDFSLPDMVDAITLPSDIKCTTYRVDMNQVVLAGGIRYLIAYNRMVDMCKDNEWVKQMDVIPAGSKNFKVSPAVNAFLFEAA